MALEVIAWSYFCNGMTLHFYKWSYSCPCRKGGQPPWSLLLGPLLPASPLVVSRSWCRRCGFMASYALLEPSTGQHGPLCPSVDQNWSCFLVGWHLSTNPSQVSSRSSPLHCMFSFMCTILMWILFHTTHPRLEVPDISYGRNRMNVYYYKLSYTWWFISTVNLIQLSCKKLNVTSCSFLCVNCCYLGLLWIIWLR
jgi:hypothetical protein